MYLFLTSTLPPLQKERGAYVQILKAKLKIILTRLE
jgi:hypothetical protein